MSKGYIILARTAEEQKAASACAYSIHISNPGASVTMAIDHINNIIKDYEEPFEYIIELPNKVEKDLRANDWQLYELAPYDNNIVIDCFSLVKEDHSALWDYLAPYDVCYGISSKNFKNEILSQRKLNDIDFVNVDMYYFKSNNESACELFNTAELYMKYWDTILPEFLELQYIPTCYDCNLIHSIVVNHLNAFKDMTPYHSNILEIIDMTSTTTNLKLMNKIEEVWSEYLNVWVSEGSRIKIQNFAINSTFVYKDNTFVTDEIYNEHRKYYKKQANLVD